MNLSIKAFILLSILVMLPDYGNTQVSIDSLWAKWQDKSKSDSIRLNAMHLLITEGYMYNLSDSAYNLSQIQYDYARSKSNKYFMADALKSQATYYFLQGDYIKAIDKLNQSWNLFDEIQNKYGIGAVLNNIGTVYNAQGLYSKALIYYKRSLEHKSLNDKYGIATTLMNIGTIYSAQDNHPKTIEYENQALELFEEINYKPGIANCLNDLGMTYLKQGDHESALELVQESLKINEELNDKSFISSNLSGLGLIHKSLNDYPKAMEYFVKSLKGFKEINERKEMAQILIEIGRLHYKQGAYSKTIIYCLDGLEKAKEINLLSEQKDACNCLYSVYKKLNNESKALYFHEQEKVCTDSLHFIETEKALQQLEFDKKVSLDSLFRVEKDRQVQFAHQEEIRKKNRTSNMAIGGGILLLVFVAALYSRLSYIRKSKSIIEAERDRSENLLLNILPHEIAQELKEKGKADARNFENVSILFSDFKEFTDTSEKLTAQELVAEINVCFQAFDTIVEKFGIEKIKTIGDAYMAAGGLPVPSSSSIRNTVLAGLEMQSFMKKRKAEKDSCGEITFEMRVGIHTGPVVAGIVGIKKFQYDVWGDTVNTSNRIETNCEVGKVNISQTTYELVKNDNEFTIQSRGKIQAKGKGELEMYYVSKKTE